MKRILPAVCVPSICVILPQTLPELWKNCVALPLLTVIRAAGSRVPFPVLEYLVLLSALWLFLLFVKDCVRGKIVRAALLALKRILRMLLAAFCLYTAIWLPLYPDNALCIEADAARLKACSDRLISELNANTSSFDILPENLPAKFIRFPFWMDALNISGFYSFFTGEALVSPRQPVCAIPFVAVHESVHGQGVANEGLCSIMAYEQCLTLGAPYADSARLWALRYLLGELFDVDPAACTDSLGRMNNKTFSLFHSMGGIYKKPRPGTLPHAMQKAFMGRYEILAHHLAANTSECYNGFSFNERK